MSSLFDEPADKLDVRLKVGDRIWIHGYPPIRRRWWQFWKPKVIDPNGEYTIVTKS